MERIKIFLITLMMSCVCHAEDVTIPFSLRRSASLVTCPAFKLGNTYTVKAKDYEKTFTLNETFTTVR